MIAVDDQMIEGRRRVGRVRIDLRKRSRLKLRLGVRAPSAAGTGQLSVKLLPQEGKDGRTMNVLSVSNDVMSNVRLFFDAQRGELARIGYDSRG